MKINNNPPSFKRVHIDLAHLEKTVGKEIANELRIAMPKIKEMATKKDIYIKGVQYPKSWYEMYNGIEVSAKTQQKSSIMNIFSNNKVQEEVMYKGKNSFVSNIYKAISSVLSKV